MADLCKCGGGIGNTGTTTCATLFGLMDTIIFVKTNDTTGAANFLDLSVTLNQALFDGLVNNTDESKRWFPTTGHLKDVTTERADPTEESNSDGSTEFISQGVRQFVAHNKGESTTYLDQFRNYSCSDLSFYMVDRSGAIQGMWRDDDTSKLFPIELSNFWTRLMGATGGTNNQNVQMNFQMAQTEFDEDLRQVNAEDLDSVDLTALEGLRDANGVYSAITTAGFDALITFDYGSLPDREPITGLVLADFTVFNVTDSMNEPLTSVTESTTTSGLYSFVYTTPVTSADVLELSGSRDTFDLTKLETPQIVTP